ncbi:High-affinity heme uptake system protein IsdE precursor [compost metagenome]
MPEMVQEMFREEFATSDIWKHFRAVQAGNVYDLSNERFGMSANLNYQEALDELRTIFYGEPAHES